MATKKEQAADVSATRLTSKVAWDQIDGEEYGGNSEIIALQVGDVSPPIIYGDRKTIQTDQGEAESITGRIEGIAYRLPLSAIFVRSCEEAGLQRGDVFHIRRNADVEKRRGKGAGNMMQSYSVKVVKRAPLLVTEDDSD